VGSVVIVPAMGVPQRFYAPLAQWLAARGFATLTFDYRGMGKSRHGSLRDVDIDIVGWAERDVAAAVDAAAGLAPGRPLTWLGHSLGGQVIAFTPNHTRARRAITIASGSGYWPENAPALRRRVPLLWYGVAPLALPLFGYFPGARLGMVGDLPHGVMEQWRSWCLHKDYACGVEPTARGRFAAVKLPINSISFTDDEMMSAANIASLHCAYASAPQSARRVAPADFGVQRIGHFGFFRPELERAWDALLTPHLAR
jgi:predicted alpha/beta hydrolase